MEDLSVGIILHTRRSFDSSILRAGRRGFAICVLSSSHRTGDKQRLIGHKCRRGKRDRFDFATEALVFLKVYNTCLLMPIIV